MKLKLRLRTEYLQILWPYYVSPTSEDFKPQIIIVILRRRRKKEKRKKEKKKGDKDSMFLLLFFLC